MSAPELLQGLRELLYDTPSTESWMALLRLFSHHPDIESVDVGIDYASAHLDHWPDQLRKLSGRHLALPPDNPHRLWALCRTLDLRSRGLKPADVEKLAQSDLVAQLTGLDLSYNNLGTAGMNALLGSPHLGNLRRLELGRTKVGNAAAGIAKAGWNLRYLGLGRTHIKATAMRELLGSRALEGLEELDLERNSVGVGGARALAANAAAGSLKVLNLRSTNIGNNGLVALSESNNLSSLMELTLNANTIDDEGFASFIASDLAGQIEVLDLGDNVISSLPPGFEGSPGRLRKLGFRFNSLNLSELVRIVRARWSDTLEELVAGSSLDRGDQVEGFGESGDFPHLEVLHLGRVLLDHLVPLLSEGRLPALKTLKTGRLVLSDDDQTVSDQLRRVGHRAVLEDIDLGFARLGDKRVGNLFGGDAAAAYRSITLTENHLTDTSAKTIVRNAALSSLEHLNIGWNALTDATLQAVAEGALTNLTSLKLMRTSMSDVGVETFCRSPMAGQVEELWLGSTTITDACVPDLVASMPRLKRLDIDAEGITFAGWEAVVRHGTLSLAHRFLHDQTVSGSTGDRTKRGGLQGFAKHLKIKGRSKLTKAELVEAILAELRDDLHIVDARPPFVV